MPSSVKYCLWATLVLVVAEASQVVAWFAGGEPSRALMWSLAGGFLLLGIAILVFGGRVEEEKERATVYGASMLPFGCFVAAAAFAGALLIIDHADVDAPELDEKPSLPVID